MRYVIVIIPTAWTDYGERFPGRLYLVLILVSGFCRRFPECYSQVTTILSIIYFPVDYSYTNTIVCSVTYSTPHLSLRDRSPPRSVQRR